VIVNFCDSFKLRELKSGGNIMLSICVESGLDKAMSIMRLQWRQTIWVRIGYVFG
jgi:hypothetical protein